MKILYYTDFFQEPLASAEGFDPALLKSQCEVLTDPKTLPEADVVIFHLPNLRKEKMPEKCGSQLWVALSVEANANYPIQSDEVFMRHFDIRMMLRQDCEIPLTYFRPQVMDLFRSRPKWKFRRATAVCFSSNLEGHSERSKYLAELGRYLEIDIYGKSRGARHLWRDRGRQTKLKVISHYAFCLCFENCQEMDYVSEKVYDALIAGTIPVYRGAPNVRDFLPAPKCAVFADEFSDPRELARFLKELRGDQHRYQEYLEWRQKPFCHSFLKLVRENAVPSLIRLYRKVCELKAARPSSGRSVLSL